MYNNLIYLFLFILGIIFDRYIIPMFDIYFNSISNKNTLEATKIQQEIDYIESKTSTHIIDGFRTDTIIDSD